MKECLKKEGRPDQVIIINLKPNSKEYISLFELTRVVGNCENGWTQIMLCLRGILVDEDASQYDSNEFEVENKSIQEPIFTMMYLNGTVKDGKIVGRWTTPGASATNSILLWPGVLKYFYDEAQRLL
jgi:hypothetical protein